jgi:thioredoxin reductase
MYDLIIVGGGPAALGALSYAQAKLLDVLMIYEDLGGKTGWQHADVETMAAYTAAVDSPPANVSSTGQGSTRLPGESHLPGTEFVRLLEQGIVTGGHHLLHDRVLRIAKRQMTFQVETVAHGQLQTASVIVATGSTPLHLAVPGLHDSAGLRLRYSLTTYAQLLPGKRVAVVAGTARALRGAAECARRAHHVTVLVPDAAILDNELGQSLGRRPNVELLVGYEATAVEQDPKGDRLRATGVGGERVIVADAIFVDLGMVPNSAMVKGLVAMDPAGFIHVTASYATTLEGLFAAGDVTTLFPEQIVGCIGAGAMAAQGAYDYLLIVWLGTAVPDRRTARSGS